MTIAEEAEREDFVRTPPSDIPAEQIVLGGMMLDRDALADVISLPLHPGDHYRPAHQLIHEVILALHGRGEPADAVSVAAELTRRGDICRTGGLPYLHTLLASVPIAANAGYYARRVREHAAKRHGIEAGMRVVQMGYAPDIDADTFVDRARREIDSVVSPGAGEIPAMADLVTQVMVEIEQGKPRGISTGLGVDLDSLLCGGWVPGQLILIAARPAVGKSVCLAQTAAHFAASHGAPALLSSLEMTPTEITSRLVAAAARVSLFSMLNRQVPVGDWSRLARAHEKLSASPLRIDYAPGCTLAQIRAQLRKLVREGVGFLGVDYLQLITAPKGVQSRQEAVAENTRELKNLAGEYGIPVVAAVQLNRNSEKRQDRRPELADLRESGELEQAADVVILLHREDAYDRESPRAGEMDLIVAKNRQGPNSTVTVAFQGHYSRVVDMARIDWTPSAALGAA